MARKPSAGKPDDLQSAEPQENTSPATGKISTLEVKKADRAKKPAKPTKAAGASLSATVAQASKSTGFRKLLRLVRSVPVIISFLSLCVAVAGYLLLRQSALRQQRETEEAKRLVWIGSIENRNTLLLSPANQDIRVVDARLFLSNGIPNGYDLVQQKFRMPLDKPAAEVRRIIETEWELHPGNGMRQVREAPRWIPLVIETTYVIQGTQHYDRTLYELYFPYAIDWGPDNNVVVTVSFAGFRYSATLDGDGETYGWLKRSWEKRVRDFLEYAGPPTPNRSPFEIRFGEIPDIPAGQIDRPWRPKLSPSEKR